MSVSHPLTVLITGATSGIGRACAEAYAAGGGCRLVLCGRRADRLAALAASLGCPTQVLCFDIQDAAACAAALATLPVDWQEIDILINNAGLGKGLSPIQEALVADWEAMIDTNVKGLLYVSRAVLPGMVARGRGHVVNIGSIAGKEVYAGGHVYCATKHAVDALTKAMRIDLLPHGIRVSQVSPGLVETEFSMVRFEGDALRAQAPYRGIQPLVGRDIAAVVWWITNLPPHVNINDVVVTPTAQANATTVFRTES